MSRPSLLSSVLAVTLVAVNIVLAHSLFLGDAGMPAYLRLKQQKQRLETKIQDLQDERVSLSSKIRLMERDPAFTERVIRERINYVREGEVVYFVSDPAQARAQSRFGEQE